MTSAAEAFTRLREALESAGVRYAIGGSWASTAFGEPRFTNDIDILADLTPANLASVLGALSSEFYFDAGDAGTAVRLGRPFNVIYMPAALKFDFFPARAFPIGLEELERAVLVRESALSATPIPFVTPEDIVLAKLHWYRAGGETSEVQWRDICGIVRSRAATLDGELLNRSAGRLGVADLLQRALSVVGRCE